MAYESSAVLNEYQKRKMLFWMENILKEVLILGQAKSIGIGVSQILMNRRVLS